MLPDGVLSTTPQPAPFIPPRNIVTLMTESYELGGIALQDPSEGLMVQPWRAWVEDTSIMIEAANHPASVLYTTIVPASEISITFDQNMFPFLAFVEAGQAKFYWYDSAIPGFVTTNMAVGVTNPRCSLDDKRKLSSGISDIILSYIRDDNLYYRQQRERYLNEHLLYPDLSEDFVDPLLLNVGMNVGQRFQFNIVGAFFPV